MRRRRIGRTSVEVGDLGFGAAQIGNLYTAVDDETASQTVDVSLGRRCALFRHRTSLRSRAVRMPSGGGTTWVFARRVRSVDQSRPAAGGQPGARRF